MKTTKKCIYRIVSLQMQYVVQFILASSTVTSTFKHECFGLWLGTRHVLHWLKTEWFFSVPKYVSISYRLTIFLRHLNRVQWKFRYRLKSKLTKSLEIKVKKEFFWATEWMESRKIIKIDRTYSLFEKVIIQPLNWGEGDI